MASACGTGQKVSISPIERDTAGIDMLSAAAASVADIDSGRVEATFDLTYGGDRSVGSDGQPPAMGVTMRAEFSEGDSAVTSETHGMWDTDPQDGELNLPMGFESRVVDGVEYAKFGLADGSGWVTLGPVSDSGSDAEWGASGAGDIADFLGVPADLLNGASGEVEVIGTEELRSGPATHHRVMVSVGAVLASSLGTPPVTPAVDEVPVDVWVNEDDLLVKLSVALTDGEGSTETTIEVFDLGADITIEAPEDAQPIDEATFSDRIIEDAFGSDLAETAVGAFGPILEDLGLDPDVAARLPEITDELRTETEGMTEVERDDHIASRAADLAGDDEFVAEALEAYFSLALGGI